MSAHDIATEEIERAPAPREALLPASAPTWRRPTRVAKIQSRWPTYEKDEIAAVVRVLQSGRVNSLHHGDHCRSFERAFAAMCGTPYAISLANGTLALELALRALKIGPGDDVVVPARSFVASASCVVNCGARPIFADVDPDSQNVTAQTVRAAMTDRTRAVIVVHLAGWPCEMDDLRALAREKNLKIIEDCAQAHGAIYKGQPVGSFGDAAAFSFCTDKIISTGGEGGMLLTRSRNVWLRAWSYKDHGKNYKLVHEKASDATFRWIHTGIGSNFRMTEMQAAIGIRQLTKLSAWINERNLRAALLNEALAGCELLRTPAHGRHIRHAYYKYYVFIKPERLKVGWSRDRILQEAASLGLPCQAGSCPEIYREKAFANGAGRPHQVLANARLLGETSILLPVDPTLTLAEVRQMGEILRYVADMAAAPAN